MISICGQFVEGFRSFFRLFLSFDFFVSICSKMRLNLGQGLRRLWRLKSSTGRFLFSVLIGCGLHLLIVHVLRSQLSWVGHPSIQHTAWNWYDRYGQRFEPIVMDVDDAINQNLNQNWQSKSLNELKVNFQRSKFYTNELRARHQLLNVWITSTKREATIRQTLNLIEFGDTNLIARVNNHGLIEIFDHKPNVINASVVIDHRLNSNQSVIEQVIRLLNRTRRSYAKSSERSVLNEHRNMLIVLDHVMVNGINLMKSFESLSDSIAIPCSQLDRIKCMKSNGFVGSIELIKKCDEASLITNKIDSFYLCLSHQKVNSKWTSQNCLNQDDGGCNFDLINQTFYLNLNHSQRINFGRSIIVLKLNNQEKQLKKATKELRQFQVNFLKMNFPIDLKTQNQSPNRFDVIPFQMLNSTNVMFDNEIDNSRSKTLLESTHEQHLHGLCDRVWTKEDRSSLMNQSNTLNVYRQLNFEIGEITMFDLIRPRDRTLTRCRTTRQLLPLQIIAQEVTADAQIEDTTMSFIVIVNDVHEAKHVPNFLRQLLVLCGNKAGATTTATACPHAWIVFQYSPDQTQNGNLSENGWSDPYRQTKVLALQTMAKHRSSGIWIRCVDIRSQSGNPVRVAGQLAAIDALLQLAGQLLDNRLLLFLHSSAQLSQRMLIKAQQLTKLNQRAYFMIPFAEYLLRPPLPLSAGEFSSSLTKMSGHFLDTDLQHFAIFHSDLLLLRRLAVRRIAKPQIIRSKANNRRVYVRCHLDPIDSCSAHVFDLFSIPQSSVDGSGFQLIRSVEPWLRLSHSNRGQCNRLGSQAERLHCLRYTNRAFGTRTQLASLLLSDEARMIRQVRPSPLLPLSSIRSLFLKPAQLFKL